MRTTLLALCLAVAGHAGAQDFHVTKNLRFNPVQEKRDAVMNIAQGMVSAFASEEKADGLTAVTRDFKGQEMPAFVLFNASVPETKLFALAEFQGRIRGSVVCKRVRVGSSPDYPHIKIGALGEDCTVKSIEHYR